MLLSSSDLDTSENLQVRNCVLSSNLSVFGSFSGLFGYIGQYKPPEINPVQVVILNVSGEIKSHSEQNFGVLFGLSLSINVNISVQIDVNLNCLSGSGMGVVFGWASATNAYIFDSKIEIYINQQSENIGFIVDSIMNWGYINVSNVQVQVFDESGGEVVGKCCIDQGDIILFN